MPDCLAHLKTGGCTWSYGSSDTILSLSPWKPCLFLSKEDGRGDGGGGRRVGEGWKGGGRKEWEERGKGRLWLGLKINKLTIKNKSGKNN